MKPLISSLKMAAVVAVAAAGLAAGQAWAADSAQVARGQQQFTYWCATCHSATPGENGRLLPGTSSLQVKYKGAKPAALEERDDLAPVFVTQVIRRGSEGMPFFRRTEISNAQMDDIAAYLARNMK